MIALLKSLLPFSRHGLWLLLLLPAVSGLGQADDKDKPLFGLRYGVLLTSDLLSGNAVGTTEAGVNFSYSPAYSQSIGAMVKFRPTGKFSFLTGICSLRRSYAMSIQAGDSAKFNRSMRITAYQIPALASVNVRSSKRSWMSAEGGLVFDFFPTNQSLSSDTFYVVSRQRAWVTPSLRIGAGWTQFTEKSGGFYIGGGYQRMLFTMSDLYLDYSLTDPITAVRFPLQGHFFSLDIGYYFPIRQ